MPRHICSRPVALPRHGPPRRDVAEYLATGTGLGNLLNESRGRLEYGMIWTVAAVAVGIAVFVTMLVQVAERQVGWRCGAA